MYTKHAVKTIHLKDFLYKLDTKICDKKHNCGPGKVHSPLPAHWREASKPSSCTLQEGQQPSFCTLQVGQQAPFLRTDGPASLSYKGQGDSKVSCYKSLQKTLWMRRISEIIEIRIHVKKTLASGWAGLSPCSRIGPLTWLAYLPAQDWPVFLLRQRDPDWTGLSPCSGTGSQTRLASLSAQEEGLGLDWPPYPRRGTWTLQEPMLCCLSQPFRAYIKINS